ncbi:hypothetical protein RFI_34427 [Reticulomyxa filosa]|uniref:Uncharacterized protein n=1 Tax=Reticulomyxa filosa TaxID=46433 RepID=X6LN11_RETFI|nr:hypothetical protein RFI_34427 [Reticulomyxa filosa]|eukprot:ETO02984.1 hypothetical protein RFI_34427 [Reticulomyxa filosa]
MKKKWQIIPIVGKGSEWTDLKDSAIRSKCLASGTVDVLLQIFFFDLFELIQKYLEIMLLILNNIENDYLKKDRVKIKSNMKAFYKQKFTNDVLLALSNYEIKENNDLTISEN